VFEKDRQRGEGEWQIERVINLSVCLIEKQCGVRERGKECEGKSKRYIECFEGQRERERQSEW